MLACAAVHFRQNCTTPPFNRNFGIFLGWHVIIWDGSQVKAFPNPDHPPLAICLFKAFVLISKRLFISIFPLVVKECHFLNYDHRTLIFLQTYVGCHLITVGSGLKTRCPWMECPSKILSCKNPSELFKFASKLRLRGSRCKNPCVSVFKNARRLPRTLQLLSRQDVKLPPLLD